MPYVLIIDSKVKISDKIFGPSKYERTFIYQILPIRLSWATVYDTVYHIQMGYFYSVFLLTCLRPGFFLISMLKNTWKISTQFWKQSEIYKTKGTIDTQGDNLFSLVQICGLWGGGAVFISWILNGQLHWTVFLLYI